MNEKNQRTLNGFLMLIVVILLQLGSIALIVYAIASGTEILIAPGAILSIICTILYSGFRLIQPNEAKVITLFGKYTGTLRKDGFYFINPFSTTMKVGQLEIDRPKTEMNPYGIKQIKGVKSISLKDTTLDNQKQKINDSLGNPIEIGIVVVWKVVDTAKAMFNVDNYREFLSIQSDSALRAIVREYPYDTPDDEDKISLRGDSLEIAEKLKQAIQEKVENAGLEILEARITHLAYSQEIAAAMLQRQQASAIIDARKMIVDGAVSMVEMAIKQLNESNLVELDDEKKAQMVSNLLVVLCGNKDAQPIVNSGSIY